MSFQPEAGVICWRLHLKAPPLRVYEALATDAGRARFWAESAVEEGGEIEFVFPNGLRWRASILNAQPPSRFALHYLSGSTAEFTLDADGQGGTDLTLRDSDVAPEDYAETLAGWVSVLLALKAALDFGVDLRGHDPERHWDHGYVEN